MSARTLVQIPASARVGEIIEIRATIGHPMETGYRRDADGRLLPRNILRSLSCHYNGERVFAARLHPAISANPYIAFHTVARASGTLELRWEGDNGFVHTETRSITVTP